MNINQSLCVAASALTALTVLTSCGGNDAAANSSNLTGSVMVDGSSTVFPITEAVAEEFFGVHSKVRVTVGESGTGGGFKKFLNDETDINDASRPIKSSELAKATEKGIEYIELPVAYDGIAIVVNKDNEFLESLTVEELSKIWSADSKVTKWSDVNPAWPAEDIKLYGPGAASGTFDYFIEVILDKEAIRADFTPVRRWRSPPSPATRTPKSPCTTWAVVPTRAACSV